jgi:hypothetical protein
MNRCLLPGAIKFRDLAGGRRKQQNICNAHSSRGAYRGITSAMLSQHNLGDYLGKKLYVGRFQRAAMQTKSGELRMSREEMPW